MTNNRDDLIRERAHRLWEREGRLHGDDQRHWKQAETEVDDNERAGKAPKIGHSISLTPPIKDKDTNKLDLKPFGEDPYAPSLELPSPDEDKITPDIDPNNAGDEGEALRGR